REPVHAAAADLVGAVLVSAAFVTVRTAVGGRARLHHSKGHRGPGPRVAVGTVALVLAEVLAGADERVDGVVGAQFAGSGRGGAGCAARHDDTEREGAGRQSG